MPETFKWFNNTNKLYMYIGEGDGNPLQCSCIENSTDRKAWQATVCGVTKSQT